MAVNLSTCIYDGIAPLTLAISNNRVSSTSQAFSRGIAFDIGGQLISASPALNDNNTWVAQTLTCANSTDWACIAELGGTYTPTSGVKATSDPTAWNGTAADFLSNGQLNSVFYNDDIRIGPQTLYGFPFYSYEYSDTSAYNGTADPAGLGLSVDSSFLRAALDARMIGTKQWSMWPGNLYSDIDGLLVLGGYDEARVDGAFQQFEVDKDTKDLYVQITKMEFKNSTKTTDLMGGVSRIWAYIEPYAEVVTLPKASYNSWINATMGQYSNASSRYEWPSIPDGDLIITFNNGHKTNIPAEDLFRRPAAYNAEGTLTVTNTTKYYQRVSQKSDKTDMILGVPFLTQKILVTDWDKGTFSLANAIKTKMSNSERNIKPLCLPAGEPIPPSPGPTPEPKKSNIAAIAGGVGGGVGGLLVIGLIAFFVVRKRKDQKKAQAQAQVAPAVSETQQYPAGDPPKYPSIGVYETGHTGTPVHAAAPVYAAQPIPELQSPQPTSPQTMHAQPSWRESRTDGYNDNSTVVNSATSGSERNYNSRSPLDSSYIGATSGPLELPSSHEMHYNTQR